ncbi:MAG: acyltransferase [Verrucomicrobiales bacterium]|nr:acyltransferase [Verrucomicrobiales bacterium]
MAGTHSDRPTKEAQRLKPASPTREYLPAVDVLRFIAALLVMFTHYGFRAWKVNGESSITFPELLDLHILRHVPLVVPLFFIISGFVIPLSAEGKSAASFARSRAVRLYPVFWLCCTLTWIITTLWASPSMQSPPWVFGVNLTLFHGLFHLPNVDAVYWTLTVEMRFYILVFVVLLLRSYPRMGLVMTLWIAASFLDQIHLLPFGESFIAAAHAPCFVAGFFYSEWHRGRLRPLTAGVLIAAIVLSLGRALDQAATDCRLTGVPISPVTTTVLMLLIHLIFAAISTRRLRLTSLSRWAPILGGITYPLYVLHNYVGITLMQALSPHLNRWINLLLVSFLACLVSWAIWRWYEKPVSHWLRQRLR